MKSYSMKHFCVVYTKLKLCKLQIAFNWVATLEFSRIKTHTWFMPSTENIQVGLINQGSTFMGQQFRI